MVSLKQFRPKDKESLSDLQSLRACYIPRLPTVLQASTVNVVSGEETSTSDPCDVAAVQRSYPLTFGQPVVSLGAITSGTPAVKLPLRVGVVFCGRQSPGGHNIVSGLFDALKSRHADTSLLGFIDGTEGLFRQETLEITADTLELYRNQGGYDLLGRTRDQIRSVQQIQKAHSACEALQLDGLVLIGGCQTCSDAAQLAESFKASGLKTKVVAVPVTIDGDLRNSFVEANVGFDTACKVYSQLISNICTDALSAEKYYYFIRLMGRHTSHVTLECALQSQPNLVILGEEVATSKSTLFDITKHICDMITLRSEQGKHHGVVLLPEGLFNSIPEAHALLQEMNDLLKQGVAPGEIPTKLSPWAAALFEFLPPYIRKQLLLDRESDGSVRLSQIETEKLLVQLVETEMSRRTRAGVYKGKKFNGISYFFGYQARGSLPSNFDCDYAYTLGHVTSHLLAAGLTGYLATVSNLKEEPALWQCGGVPITALMAVKRWLRGPEVSEIGKPLVHPAKVDLKGKPYELLSERASMWIRNDFYRNLGPLQFSGAAADMRAMTLQEEEHDYVGRIEKLRQGLAQVKDLVRPGCPPEALSVALTSIAALVQVLSVITSPAYRSQTPF